MTICSIRRADTHDAADLKACIDAAYAKYFERIEDLPSVSENCAEEIAEHLVWVAEKDDDIVGGLVLIPCEKYMLLANVAVHPDHNGLGIGSQLLKLADSEAEARGYGELRLNTHVDMQENIWRYERKGWLTLSQNGSKITMRKFLRS